ncbi:serine racemase-like isoform X7 [Rhinoraja longicauda]
MLSQYCVSLGSIQKAQSVIGGLVHLTPVLTNSTLDQRAERQIFLKCELFQKTGSFKAFPPTWWCRGLRRPARRPPWRATERSSLNASPATRSQTSRRLSFLLGVEDSSRGSPWPSRLEGPNGLLLHLLSIVTPRRPQTLRPDVKIYAAEPENADDCYRSKRSGQLTPNARPPVTLADAVKTSVGPNTWPIIRDLVDDVFTVSEQEIQSATRLVWERAKLVIEPTAGLGVAAILSRRFRGLPGGLRKVCVVLCGGNVDLDSLRWLGAPEGAD